MNRLNAIFIVIFTIILGALFAFHNYGNNISQNNLRKTSYEISEDAKNQKNIHLPKLEDLSEIGQEGIKTSHAKAIINYLSFAKDHGLQSIDPAPIKQVLENGKRLDDNQKQVLKDAVIKIADELNGGRINWNKARYDWDMRPKKIDNLAGFELALKNDDIENWLKTLAPQHDAYRALVGARHKYSEIVKAGDFIKLGEIEELKIGSNGSNVALLRARLNQEGYNANNITSPEVFDENLKTKLALFQKYHGIKQSGTLNKETLKALEISAKERLEQIDLNLERERWVPREITKTRIEANITSAHVAYIEDNKIKLEMPSIVGAIKSKTPMLASHIHSIVLNPPWYKPASIKGRVRVQKPGPNNALGRVKFDMANNHSVFLHDTPNHGLFSAHNRTLSHGCVRLHYPKDLAEILAKAEGYNREKIDEITKTVKTHRIKLKTKTPVLILYRTAYVDVFANDGGIVQFPKDVYSWDPLLKNLLFGTNIDENLGAILAKDDRNVAAP
ncbi:MAG: L,D-transpeptidase family protein [Caulobacterales bacterium]|nr:L,D-transpeptidase family protein [Caulobacterales bacterium]